jgi:hypothetical protein
MVEHWIHQSETILKKIETFLEQKPKDRLERITEILFTLNVLDMSLHGWRGWIQNLNFMSHFSDEDAFVEYDIEITTKHQAKIPQALIAERDRTTPATTQRTSLYV